MSVRLDVDVVRQSSNPVCWLACATMILQYSNRQSIADEQINYPHGNLRDSTSIQNIGGWRVAMRFLRRIGFELSHISEMPNPRYQDTLEERRPNVHDRENPGTLEVIEWMLQQRKPLIIAHHCGSFSYGPAVTTPNNGLHAVVITGIDREKGRMFFNNPWGQKDVMTTAASISASITRFENAFELPSIGYLSS